MGTKMKHLEAQDSFAFAENSGGLFGVECWFDDACFLDMDYFLKTLYGMKAKGVRPDLIGSMITHYASKWLPDLSSDEVAADRSFQQSPESVTASWMKKKFFIENLVGVIPSEKDSVHCNFLLRLLRIANMVGVESAFRTDLEKRISRQLDQASLQELMIPSFSHTCGTLLDVELVLRLVQRFLSLDESISRNGATLTKVAKLVDCYLAEAAVDTNLSISMFISLAGDLPSYARSSDDGLYRAIDTYLKAHQGLSKQERKSLCRLMDCRKLSPEASTHAAQNERLPVREVIQILFSEQAKMNKQIDWSGSFTRSPNMGLLDHPARCLSKREINGQQFEIKKLKEDVLRLQSQCMVMQGQIEKLMEKKRGGGGGGGGGFFSWKKIGILRNGNKFGEIGYGGGGGGGEGDDHNNIGFGRQTPVDMKTRLVRTKPSSKWRKSLS